ncbi:XRE family transcriptional regulator [Clostridium botulinum]|nr:XRE family transcriptional regulator [Clostridium botulinum]MCS4516647.1 XRE family transcriptional regulator [Clostridium botulinum]
MTIEEKISGLAWNKKLEILRRINNWTQEEAADKCNATQKCIGVGKRQGATQEKLVVDP